MAEAIEADLKIRVADLQPLQKDEFELAHNTIEGDALRENYRLAGNLVRNLRGCSSRGLFRKSLNSGGMSYIGSHTCKSKLCNVCNAARARTLRRKYWSFFDDKENSDLREGCDFMHLTLTVPHREKTGWRGEKVYVKELLSQFNVMRKYPWWLKSVHGGELCVEFTRNGNGFHCHIHALLLVYKFRRSRNKLAAWITETWNKLTVDEEANRQGWTMADVRGIRRSHSGMPWQEFKAFFRRLDPRGSTLVGCESLYVTSDKPREGYRWSERHGKYIYYISGKSKPKTFMAGILECLKYHFEPMSLTDDEGHYDTRLIIALLPAIYGQRLYSKFGALYGRKELSITVTLDEEIKEALEEMAEDAIFDPETGDAMLREEFYYLVADPATAVVMDERIKIRGQTWPIPGRTTKDAFIAMTEFSIAGKIQRENRKQKIKPRI